MKRAKRMAWIIVILAVILLFRAIGTICEAIWQERLHYQNVFLKIFFTDLSIFLIALVVLFAATFYMLRAFIARYEQSVIRDILREAHPLVRRLQTVGITLVSIVVGLLGASVISDIGWSQWLLFIHHVAFGQTDPIFHHDISFYVFDLPVYQTVLYTFEVITILYAIGATVLYGMLNYAIEPERRIERGIERAWRLVCLLWGLWVFAFGVSYVFKRYDLLYDTNGVVVGVGYTQAHVTLPYYTIASIVCFVFSILLFARSVGIPVAKPIASRLGRTIFGASILRVAIPIAVIVMMIVGALWETVVQHVIVAGNEAVNERPYLQMNIAATRTAFGIGSGHLTEGQYDMTQSLTKTDVQANQDIIRNVRINDPRNLAPVYNQLQSFKVFNEFLDIDVDRYGGQEMYLSAREMNQDKLPAQAQTWVNKTLVYTHGYGIVASPVNQVNETGEPILSEKDMPITGSLNIQRPAIYFGEENDDPVIVHSGVGEFDYPQGDSDATTHYNGLAGVPMTGINRLLFAWNQGSIKMLTSPQVDASSRLLLHRNIYDRIHAVAPFLRLDKDAYIVVRDNGDLDWIVDAYTSTDRYPYSEGVSVGDDQNNWSANYVRNSVKVVVSAYDGTVTLYQIDQTDPIANSWAKVFPGVMKTDVPADLMRHFRYPETLFKAQSHVLQTYHMQDPTSFYNRDDVWAIPNEEFDGKTQPLEPNYIMMKLPGQSAIEFVLAQPFTPANKNNLVSWLVARSDEGHYGELKLYTFPRGTLLYGPMQTENLIDQTPAISQQLTLWNQSGSRVIRGNLLALPMANSVLYVEPLYLVSERQGSLPEVKRVIVANKDRIVMADTLDSAMNQLFGTASDASGGGTGPSGSTGTGIGSTGAGGSATGTDGGTGSAGTGTNASLAKQAAAAIQAYKAATARGDYETAGRELTQLQHIIDAMNAATTHR